MLKERFSPCFIVYCRFKLLKIYLLKVCSYILDIYGYMSTELFKSSFLLSLILRLLHDSGVMFNRDAMSLVGMFM